MHKDWPQMARELSGAIKEVRVGAPDGYGSYVITPALARVQAAAPGIRATRLTLGGSHPHPKPK